MKTKTKAAQPIPLPPLNDELLQRTCGSEVQWSDSRRFPRKITSGRCLLVPEGTYRDSGYVSPRQEVLLRNLSRGGARLLHGGELFPGETFELQLPAGSSLRLKVVWCQRQEPGVYLSGCHFSEPL
jgi:hypothetical protein